MTITISGLDLSKLRNAEFIQFGTQIITITGSYNPDALKVKNQYDALNLKLIQVDGMYKLQQGSALTVEVEKADERRDRAITGISMFLDSRLNHYIPEEVSAARVLRLDLDKYGSAIARQNLNSQTAILTNIANDWKNKAELRDAVVLLNLMPWLDELDSANKAFDILYLQRNKEAINNPVDTLKTLRLETNELYYLLRDKLQAYANINEFADPYDKILKEWNNLIESYNTLMANRAGDNEDTPPPPTPVV